MDDATVALKFLLSKDQSSAYESLAVLDELNSYRKTIQERISNEAEQKSNKEDRAVIVWAEDWHEGIIGIVASKLSNSYKNLFLYFQSKMVLQKVVQERTQI